jgi:hypothetical protein
MDGMKVLFLDIDGVVNNARATHGLWPIDPISAALVRRIELETNCKIVLSSVWRNSLKGIAVVQTKVTSVFSYTPTIEGVVLRGEEIKKWMDDRRGFTSRYAILDDDDDMLPEQLPNFFQTTWEEGLTEEITSKVIAHLNA